MASLINRVSAITAGLAGALAETGADVTPRRASADVNAGLVVCPGATTGTCKVPTTAAEVDDALGVVVYSPVAAPGTTTTYVANETLPVCEKGCIWMVCEGAMAETDDVYVRYTAKGGNTALGAVRANADSGGATFTVLAAANADVYTVQVDGIPFEVTYTDGSPSDDEAATALAAAIDAHASYAAAAVGAVVTVLLSANNNVPVTLTSTDPKVLVNNTAAHTARKHPRFRVRESVTGAGLVKIQVSVA